MQTLTAYAVKDNGGDYPYYFAGRGPYASSWSRRADQAVLFTSKSRADAEAKAAREEAERRDIVVVEAGSVTI